MFWSRIGMGLALSGAIGFSAFGAHALTATELTATDLKCKGCVGSKDLGKKAIKSKHIKDGQVKTPDLQDGAVTTDKIGDGAVTLEKLDPAAQPSNPSIAAASEFEGNFGPALTIFDNDTLIRTVTINTPGPGAIVATGGLNIIGADGDDIECLVSLTNTIVDVADKSGDPSLTILPNVFARMDDGVFSVSQTRTFEVTTAAAIPIFLVCEAAPGDSATGFNQYLSAIYVPEHQLIESAKTVRGNGVGYRSARTSAGAE